MATSRTPWGKYHLPRVVLSDAPSSLFAKFNGHSKQDSSKPNKHWFEYRGLPDGSVYLRWAGHFEFLVSPDGRQVSGQSLGPASHEAFQTYLLGQVLSHSLLKLAIEPLHATVVDTHLGGVGFLGDSGTGKSVLAGSFIAAGHQLLTDDLLVLKKFGPGYRAYPGLPRLKLFPVVAKRLFGKQMGGVPMNCLTRKLILPLEPRQFLRSPTRLKVLYLLSPLPASGRGKKVTIRQLSARNAFLKLLGSTFNRIVVNPERLRRQFEFISELVRDLPVKLLSYPRTVAALPAVRDAILTDVQQ